MHVGVLSALRQPVTMQATSCSAALRGGPLGMQRRGRMPLRCQAVAAPVKEVLETGSKDFKPEVPPGLNKYSSHITQPKSQGASQAMLYATGLVEDDMNKPQVRVRRSPGAMVDTPTIPPSWHASAAFARNWLPWFPAASIRSGMARCIIVDAARLKR